MSATTLFLHDTNQTSIETSKHSWEYYLYSTGAAVIYLAVMQRLGSGYEFACDCKGNWLNVYN